MLTRRKIHCTHLDRRIKADGSLLQEGVCRGQLKLAAQSTDSDLASSVSDAPMAALPGYLQASSNTKARRIDRCKSQLAKEHSRHKWEAYSTRERK